MNLQTWAEWVAQMDAITGGGRVELLAGPGQGMTIAVHWTQDGKRMRYDHALSMHEITAMCAEVQPCVLESITHAVRKMTPNAEVRGPTAALSPAAPSRLTGSAAAYSENENDTEN